MQQMLDAITYEEISHVNLGAISICHLDPDSFRVPL
jgi:hypothetical protein